MKRTNIVICAFLVLIVMMSAIHSLPTKSSSGQSAGRAGGRFTAVNANHDLSSFNCHVSCSNVRATLNSDPASVPLCPNCHKTVVVQLRDFMSCSKLALYLSSDRFSSFPFSIQQAAFDFVAKCQLQHGCDCRRDGDNWNRLSIA